MEVSAVIIIQIQELERALIGMARGKTSDLL